MEKKRAYITLRCTPSLKNRVRALAESSHRSISKEVIYLVELGMASLERGEVIPSRAPVVQEPVYEDEGGLAEW